MPESCSEKSETENTKYNTMNKKKYMARKIRTKRDNLL